MNEQPKTLLEAVRYFSDADRAFDFVKSLRWPTGEPVCPHCGCLEHSFLTTRRIWKCKSCRRQFSIKVGSIFEDSPNIVVGLAYHAIRLFLLHKGH